MQLSSFESITEDNIVFQAAKKFKIPNSKMKYERIKIERQLPDGKTTPLVVATPILFSFGISERKDQETNKINGYSIPVCLWKKDAEPNQKETNFLNIIKKYKNFAKIIFQENMVKIVFLICYITNKLNMLIKKVKPRRKRMNLHHQFFM